MLHDRPKQEVLFCTVKKRPFSVLCVSDLGIAVCHAPLPYFKRYGASLSRDQSQRLINIKRWRFTPCPRLLDQYQEMAVYSMPTTS